MKGKKNITNLRGAAMLIVVLLATFGSLLVSLGLSRGVYSDMLRVRDLAYSRQVYFSAESALEDMALRLMNADAVGTTEALTIEGVMATSTYVAVVNNRLITASSSHKSVTRSVEMELEVAGGVSFNFGLQAGTGGIDMQNTSSVRGNIYANGPVTGANSNMTYGSVVSAGPTGLINGIHATGSAYAHTIQNSIIDRDAYYQSISGSTVGGFSYPGSTDQATSSLPIPDSFIETWKAEAAAGTVISAAQCSGGKFEINSSTTTGPLRVQCDLEISGTGDTITLGGAVWVEGNVTFKNSQTIRASASLGSVSVPIIADNVSNRTTSSKISIENSTVFQGSGSAGSYIILVSQNSSAEGGGSEIAIDMKNTVTGSVLVYAGHGLVELQNSISLKEATAYMIRLKNSAQVIYESGIASLLFTSGPGGSYVVGAWDEIE